MNPYCRPKAIAITIGAALAGICATSVAHAVTPSALLSTYAVEAGSPGVPTRGMQFFTSRHGRDWSCSSCHGAMPTALGKHASTGKPIGALAPAINPDRFSDTEKVEKWFRRNCNDVVGRVCTATEKADVLSWLLTLKQ